ncbi:OLC1v1033568C1 [Oldenlandia corymbosa var. corymbosa]|uniref:OLC1v1033568C1 n=1 Tax=Oldenlandia corymbosa var. corymbosa TaxID=529605 RepID=A0AAV1CRQ9_OLDCO|nr:OLC1v1033568C1 [Oldenlandia corymbosa var. corymbosa]
MAHPNYPPVAQTFYPPTAAPPPPPPPQAIYPPLPPYYYPTTKVEGVNEHSSGTYYAQPAAPAGYPAAYQPPPAAYPPAYPPPPPSRQQQSTCTVPAERPSQAIIPNPIPVVGLQYCLPRPVDLMIVRKLMTLTDDFSVTDVENNMMFKVKGKLMSLHDKRVLLNAAGNPVLTLSNKILSAHKRWQVFRGASTHPSDLIFSARTSSMIQLKTKLNVYLANRTTEDVCDFKVQGSWAERSCTVFVGESTTVAARVSETSTNTYNFELICSN